MLRRALVLLAAGAACVGLAACGTTGDDPSGESAALVLDFQPNAVHAGIYLALQRDYVGAEGVNLVVRAPGSTGDGVKSLLGGRAQFAILDIHDLAIAREQGRDLVGVMAIVEDPLAAVVAAPGIATPKALAGKRVGVTGVPSDTAVLDSIVRGAGADPASIHKTTIGFNAVQAVASGRVAGATAFWNVEGVELKARRPGARVFRVDDYGAPSYPELVLTTTRQELQDDPGLVKGVVHALQRGERAAVSDPESAVEALTARNPSLRRDEVGRDLDAVQSAFQAPNGSFGTLDPRTLTAWAAWEQRFGIVRRPPDPVAMFDGSFAASGRGQATQDSG